MMTKQSESSIVIHPNLRVKIDSKHNFVIDNVLFRLDKAKHIQSTDWRGRYLNDINSENIYIRDHSSSTIVIPIENGPTVFDDMFDDSLDKRYSKLLNDIGDKLKRLCVDNPNIFNKKRKTICIFAYYLRSDHVQVTIYNDSEISRKHCNVLRMKGNMINV